MKELSVQNFSVLGLLLIGVYAVTAVVLPSTNESNSRKFDQPGSLTASNDNCLVQSCTPTASITYNMEDEQKVNY